VAAHPVGSNVESFFNFVVQLCQPIQCNTARVTLVSGAVQSMRATVLVSFVTPLAFHAWQHHDGEDHLGISIFEQ